MLDILDDQIKKFFIIDGDGLDIKDKTRRSIVPCDIWNFKLIWKYFPLLQDQVFPTHQTIS